jgi:chromosome condensin MukBEF MukE localization factor
MGVDVNFVAGANLILFLISISGLLVQSRSVRSANANAFIRGIYSSLIIKMFTVIAAILIYVAIMSHELNKEGIFIAMAFYMLYTSVEVFQLMKIVRKKSDG